MSLIRIKYNATRFPRTVILRNHGKKVFLAERREIDFEEYDAYMMLRNNIRLNPDNWEFNVVGVVEDVKEQEKIDTEIRKDVETEIDIGEKPKKEKPAEKPHRGKPKK